MGKYEVKILYEIMERERYSGIVSWTDSQIEWQNPDGPDVVISLDEVVVIGEYTTDAGPHFDDWLLIFVCKTGEWESIPVYAEGTGRTWVGCVRKKLGFRFDRRSEKPT